MPAPSPAFARRYVIAAAIVATATSPLLALAYFASPDGSGSLAQASIRAWAEPARDLLEPLLTFAGPDRVYATYLQVLALCAPALVIGRRLALADLPRGGRLERAGRRLTGIAYPVAVAALGVLAILLVGLSPSDAAVDLVFLAAMLPGMLLSLVGSSLLGIALVRAGGLPRAASWLLALAVPGWIVGSLVLGHNSLGMLAPFAAWAVAAAHREEPATAPVAASGARQRAGTAARPPLL